MTIRVGINGFGRMGRLGLRAGWVMDGFEIVRINDLACDPQSAAHLLTFDSVQGRWLGACESAGDRLLIDGRSIPFTRAAEIAGVDWSDCDIVIEATGVHHKRAGGLDPYFAQGVRKVVVAAPTEGALDVVMGVNHDRYDPAKHAVVTAASCTTNCLAPVVKVLHEGVGIAHGSMTTIHSLTNTQSIVDTGHKDLRRARACGVSLIPTTTGSARAITRIFPDLEGKLNGHAVRVPLLTASLTDCVFETRRPTSVEEVNALFRNAAAGPLAHILGYDERPLVSVDYVGDPRSAIVDGLSTLVIDRRQVKVYAWYDNEWGYANRLMELTALVARSL